MIRSPSKATSTTLWPPTTAIQPPPLNIAHNRRVTSDASCVLRNRRRRVFAILRHSGRSILRSLLVKNENFYVVSDASILLLSALPIRVAGTRATATTTTLAARAQNRGIKAEHCDDAFRLLLLASSPPRLLASSPPRPLASSPPRPLAPSSTQALSSPILDLVSLA